MDGSKAQDEKGRATRLFLRSKTKREEEDKEERERRKNKKKTDAEDLAEAVKLMSPFLCLEPQPSLESRVQWALEWTELGVLKNLPPSFNAETRKEVTAFLNNYKTKAELFAYFGLVSSYFYKYQAQVREAKESKDRVAKLTEQPVCWQRLRLQMQCAHSILQAGPTAELGRIVCSLCRRICD
jgi:hypothetical protein